MNTLVRYVFASPHPHGYGFHLSFLELNAGDHGVLDGRLRGSTILPRMPDIVPLPDLAILLETLVQPRTLRQSRWVCWLPQLQLKGGRDEGK